MRLYTLNLLLVKDIFEFILNCKFFPIFKLVSFINKEFSKTPFSLTEINVGASKAKFS